MTQEHKIKTEIVSCPVLKEKVVVIYKYFSIRSTRTAKRERILDELEPVECTGKDQCHREFGVAGCPLKTIRNIKGNR